MIDFAAQLELWFTVASVLGLAYAARDAAVRDAARVRRWAVIAFGVVAVALLRGLLTRFSLLHANLHATAILDAVHAHPLVSTRSYGIFHSAFYGGVMRAFGADLRSVAWANEGLAAVTLGLMAWLGARYAERRTAAVFVVALGLLHPVLLRIAGSEEGHGLAVALSFVALAAFEVHRTSDRPSALVAAASAMVLMVGTKQILVASVPCVVAIALGRARPEQRREILRHTLPVIGMIALRCVEWSVDHPAPRVAERLSPTALGIALTTHPLLDLRGPAPLLLVPLIAGCVVLLRGTWATRSVVASLAVLFASSFTLFEGQAVVFTFRLPVLTLAVVIAGIGADALVAAARARRAPARSPDLTALGCAVVLGAAYPFAPGFEVVRAASPQTLEYEYLRTLAERLPRTLTLVELAPHGASASDPFPRHLLARAGVRARFRTPTPGADREDSRAPRFFFEGLGCSVYSTFELVPAGGSARSRAATHPGRAFGSFPIDPSLTAPTTPRPECRRLAVGAEPFDRARSVPTPRQAEAPFLIYVADVTRVRMLRLPESGAASTTQVQGAERGGS